MSRARSSGRVIGDGSARTSSRPDHQTTSVECSVHLGSGREEDLERLGKLQRMLDDERTESTLFAKVEDVKTKTRKNWESFWKQLSPGKFVKI